MNKQADIPVPLSTISLIGLAKGTLSLAILLAMASAALSILPMWLIYGIVTELSQTAPDMSYIWQQIGCCAGH